MEERTIQRYLNRNIVLHWLHTFSFLLLSLTGILRLFDFIGSDAGSYVRNIHHIAALLFIGIPVFYFLAEIRGTTNFLKETFRWGKEDWKWILAAPDYYFGGSSEKLPPQDRINTGQKLWQLLIIVTGLILAITGIFLYFFRLALPVYVFPWMLLVHGIAFVIIFLVFILHTYLALLHPHFRESWHAMIDGRISDAYAREHYSKWYQKINRHTHK
jgi:formate dehydrogenase subunit gamma